MTYSFDSAGSPQILVTFPSRDLANLSRIFPASGSTRYLYLGKDFFRRRSVQQTLGGRFRRLDIAKLHDEVANEIRPEHLHWIDRLNRRYGNDLEWWFGAVASRNIYSSNLFQYTCYLEMLERLWQAADQRPHLIVVESMGLAKAIQTWGSKKGIDVSIIGKKIATIIYLSNLLKQTYRFIKYCLKLMLHVCAAYLSRKNRPKPLVKHPRLP